MPLEALRWDVTPGRAALPADPLRHPARRPGRVAARDRRLRGAAALAVARRPARSGRGRRRSRRWSAPATGGRAWSRGRSASRGCQRRSAPDAGAASALADLLAEAGPLEDAVEVVFTGLDGGVEGGVRAGATQRALPLDEALAAEVAAGLRPERRAAAAAARLPAPARRSGLVRDDERQVARADRRRRRPFDGLPAGDRLPLRPPRRTRATPVTRMAPRALMAPPGEPDFLTRAPSPRRRADEIEGRAWSGRGSIASARGEHGRRHDLARRLARARAGAGLARGAAGRSRGTPRPAITCSAAARRTTPATSSRTRRSGTSAATRTTPCSACGRRLVSARRRSQGRAVGHVRETCRRRRPRAAGAGVRRSRQPRTASRAPSGRRLDERQPVTADLVAEQVQRRLDRDRVRRDLQQLDRRPQLPVERARAVDVARAVAAHELRTCGPTTCVWTHTPPTPPSSRNGRTRSSSPA